MAIREKERKDLITEIEDSLRTKIIVYYTSTKQPIGILSGGVSTDTVPIFYEHLKNIKNRNLALFLNTAGGSLDAPWPIVNIIRNYTDNFHVYVPSQAMSAGTLICLGAEQIVMSPLSQLSPVDPAGHFEKDGKKYDIEVENIIGYIDLAKEKIGIKSQNVLEEILRQLSTEYPPSFLGSINRTHSLIRRLAEKLLRLHLKSSERKKINKIVEQLTSKLFSHKHFINRYEAKHLIGMDSIIKYATDIEENLMFKISELYSTKILGESEPLNINNLEEKNNIFPIAIIDSGELQSEFQVNIMVDKSKMPYRIDKFNIGWVTKGVQNV
jgi:ATP-dependent protease ClpP protease subunit